MKVISAQLRKERLLALAENERRLFLAVGHAANEINAITKMLYWSGNAPIRDDAEQRGQNTLALLLLRLLAGNLNETWELLRTNFFANALSRTYEPKLDTQAKASLDSLKRYFGRTNAVHHIRNNFAFHYSPTETASALADVNEEFHVYMQRDAAPNNLFAFSEAVLATALLKLLHQIGGPASLEELVGELLEVAAWFAQVIDALMFAIIDHHGQELRTGDAQGVRFQELQEFHSVTIPWFTDTTKILESQRSSP